MYSGVTELEQERQDLWEAISVPLFHSGVTAISLKQTEHIFPGRADKFTPAQVPIKPAAIRIYKQRGGHHYTTCIAFDFDTKRSDPETVAQEVKRLRNYLYEFRGEVVVDQSLNGGQHVYLPLREETTLPTTKKFVHRLKSHLKLTSLDTAPMSGSKGAIRTPGARHKDGGHQMLVTNFESAKAIIAYRNPDFDIKRAFKELPESDHEKLDNLTIQYDVNDDARQRHIDAFTILRDNTIIGALTKGTWRKLRNKKGKRFPSASEGRLQVFRILYHVCKYDDDMFFSAVYSGDFPGLKKSLQRKIEPGHTFETSPTIKKLLERDWKKATRNTDGTMIPQGLRVKPEPETFIRPLLREDITGGFTQGMREHEANREHYAALRQWHTVINLLWQQGVFSDGARGARTLRTLEAVAYQASWQRRAVFRASYQEISLLSGDSVGGAHKIIKKIQNLGLLRISRPGKIAQATYWQLQLPTWCNDLAKENWLPCGPVGIHAYFRNKKPALYAVWHVLEHGRGKTAEAIAEETQLSFDVVRRATQQLARHGLANGKRQKDHTKTWRRASTDDFFLNQAAEQTGAATALQTKSEKYSAKTKEHVAQCIELGYEYFVPKKLKEKYYNNQDTSDHDMVVDEETGEIIETILAAKKDTKEYPDSFTHTTCNNIQLPLTGSYVNNLDNEAMRPPIIPQSTHTNLPPLKRPSLLPHNTTYHLSLPNLDLDTSSGTIQSIWNAWWTSIKLGVKAKTTPSETVLSARFTELLSAETSDEYMSAVVSLLHAVWGLYKTNGSYVNRAGYRTMVRDMPALRVPTKFGMVPAPGASPWEDWFDYLSSYDVFQDGRKLPEMSMVDYFVCAFDWLGDHFEEAKVVPARTSASFRKWLRQRFSLASSRVADRGPVWRRLLEMSSTRRVARGLAVT